LKGFSKTDERIESKLNKSIKSITEYIDNLKYNYAIIELRSLFNSLPEKTSKDVLEKFLKILQPFCPHIAEEFWEKLGNKEFISIAKWPEFEENKINENLEKEEKIIEQLIEDINSIQNLFSKEKKKAEMVYVYIIPNEKKLLEENIEMLEKKTKLKVKICLVNDKDKYDPQGKSKRAKPGKPALYLE
jgi:leucyl-tRNA synthetase